MNIKQAINNVNWFIVSIVKVSLTVETRLKNIKESDQQPTKLPSAISGIIKISFLVAAIGLSLGLLSSHRAYACDNQCVDMSIPTDIQAFIGHYDQGLNNPNEYFYDNWISQVNTPTQDSSVSLPNNGAPNVALQVNGLTYLYHTIVNGQPQFPTDGSPTTAAALSYNQSPYTLSVTSCTPTPGCSGGRISNGATGQINTYYNGNTRYWFGSTTPNFTYTPAGSGGFTSSQTVTITETYTPVNTFHNNDSDSYCVAGGAGPYTSAYALAHCPSATRSFTITIDVPPASTPPEGGWISSNCNLLGTPVQGWAQDPNDPSVQLTIEITTNAGYTDYVVGNQAGYGYPPGSSHQNDGFRVVLPPTALAASGDTYVTVVAETVTNTGEGTGFAPLNYNGTDSNTHDIGDCGIPTLCSSSNPACCPNYPTANITNVPVSLPYAGPDHGPPATVSQPANQSAPSSPYYQDVPQGIKLLSIQDSNPASDSAGVTATQVAGTEKDGSPGSTSSASGSVNLNYTNYLNVYPYDTNLPTVTYANYYNQTRWTASSPKSSCPGLYPPQSGPTCSYTYPATATPQYSCPNGGTPEATGFGELCNNNGSFYPATVTYTYTCNSGDSLSGTTCTHSQPATYTYTWTAGTTTSETINATTGQSGQYPVPSATLMLACINRTYNLTPQVSGSTYNSTISFNDTEAPTSVSYNGSVYASFGEAGSGGKNLRQSNQVDGVPTSVTFRVYHTYSNNDREQVFYETVPGSSADESYTASGNGPTDASDNSVLPVTDSVSLPPLQYGDQVCADLSVSEASGQVNPNPPNPWAPVGPSGTKFQVTGPNGQGVDDQWPNTGVGATTGGLCTTYLGAKPYFKIFGGDAVAGTSAAPSNSCSQTSAIINAWNRGSSGGYAGSGTQLAAIAGGPITGFASAQLVSGNSPPLPIPPIGLSFANNNGGYGGNYGGNQSDCATDYYNQGQPSAIIEPNVQTAISTALASGPGNYAYSVPGGTITSAPVIPAGYNIAIYSSAAIDINTNISYGGVSTNPALMPNLEIITSGAPINIANNVTQLAGNFVAENSAINDCYNVPSNNWYYDPQTPTLPITSTCALKLTIIGSFNAQTINLERTNGTLHQATANEAPGATNVAEEFDYSPAVWLTEPNRNTAPEVQAVTSLPPVL